MSALEKEFKFYLDNQEELVGKHNGKVLVIIGEKVVDVYDDESDAFIKSMQKYEPGTFLIQVCSPGDEGYTQHYHSRVSFV